jgi:transglutaminase-like putative cysteine protease
MRYDVTLTIESHFPSAVADARQILHVRPRAGFSQRVERVRLRLSPEPAEAVEERDFFGNPADHLAFAGGYKDLRIEMQARVETEAAPTRPENGPSLAALALAARGAPGLDPLDPAHFLGPSRMVDPADPALAPLGAELLGDPRADAFDAVLALAAGIKGGFRYSPGATRIDTPLAEVAAARAGVCQDFTHLGLALLRRGGVPAAYASGFLRTDPPPGKPRLPHADAMHAWFLAWLGSEAGWVGFDPTNGVVCGPDHILVAVGRDYADVAPVSGVLVTAGPQSAGHTVDVVPVEASAPAGS